MGNAESINVSQEKQKFGSIYGKDGIFRPGYYWKKGNVTRLIYHGNEIPLLLEEADFKSLKYGYFLTNKRVFYKGEPILNANPKTFSTIKRENVKTLTSNAQKNIELARLNSVLGMDYICNKKRIYYKNNIIYSEN
jgi:hypothetical protein